MNDTKKMEWAHFSNEQGKNTENILNMKIKGKCPQKSEDKDRNNRLAKMSHRREEEHERKLRMTETEGNVLVAR
jgi:hypothetical protein